MKASHFARASSAHFLNCIPGSHDGRCRTMMIMSDKRNKCLEGDLLDGKAFTSQRPVCVVSAVILPSFSESSTK